MKMEGGLSAALFLFADVLVIRSSTGFQCRKFEICGCEFLFIPLIILPQIFVSFDKELWYI